MDLTRTANGNVVALFTSPNDSPRTRDMIASHIELDAFTDFCDDLDDPAFSSGETVARARIEQDKLADIYTAIRAAEATHAEMGEPEAATELRLGAAALTTFMERDAYASRAL